MAVVAKVGYMAVRAAMKPAIKSLGKYGETNETFRNICITLADKQHALAHRAQRVLTPYETRASSGAERRERALKKLGEDEAVQIGVTLVVELSTLSVAAAVLTLDQMWNRRKNIAEKARRRDVEDRLEELVKAHAALERDFLKLAARLDEGWVRKLAIAGHITTSAEQEKREAVNAASNLHHIVISRTGSD